MWCGLHAVAQCPPPPPHTHFPEIRYLPLCSSSRSAQSLATPSWLTVGFQELWLKLIQVPLMDPCGCEGLYWPLRRYFTSNMDATIFLLPLGGFTGHNYGAHELKPAQVPIPGTHKTLEKKRDPSCFTQRRSNLLVVWIGVEQLCGNQLDHCVTQLGLHDHVGDPLREPPWICIV